MIQRILFLLLAALPILLPAQTFRPKTYTISVFNNATMLPPASFTAVLNQPVHPGIAAGMEMAWKEKTYGKWFQNATIGFFSHRYVYRALLLYTQAGYRHYLGHLSVEGSIEAGYMHAFLLTDRLVPQGDGTYKSKKGFGKPQFIAGAGLGVGSDLVKKHSARMIFLDYDFRLQMPFVKSYVPLLPNGAVSLGFQFSLD